MATEQAGITHERELNVYFYNEVSGQWSAMLPCPGCTQDIEANRFTIVLNDLSPFAVMGGLGKNQSYHYLYVFFKKWSKVMLSANCDQSQQLKHYIYSAQLPLDISTSLWYNRSNPP